ncbi:MAG: phosphodiester glycosidase family protein [Bacteroidales bacterium]|nr:phosphodiester glycosidase family protein [Bacteroidales bacterium]
MLTIRASLPEEPLTKAGFTVPDEGTGLHLVWKEGDCIRVVSGDASALYQIDEGFTDHQASFTGPEVPGGVFDIICPGTYESAAEAETGDPTLTQTGNGSTDHLVFTARLCDVAKADLPEIAFTDAWVADHAGVSLNKGGIVKFVLTLPSGVSNPSKVLMQGLGKDISVNLQDIELGSDRVLTAYAQSGWEDIAIGGKSFTVTVMDADGTAYAVTKTISGDKTLKAGAQNTITIKKGFTAQLFAGGDGTASSPYLIASAVQLNNMHKEGVLKHQDRVYFRLIEDIDMNDLPAGTAWVPLNWADPYDYCVNFDGGGHTIDHFTCSFDENQARNNGETAAGVLSDNRPYDKPAFFGLLYGECYDLSFTNAVITNTFGTPTGILAGYCGYSGKKATVWNVHVQGSVSFTSASGVANNQTTCVGGFAGRVDFAFIDSCSADVDVTSNKHYVGGFFGIDWGEASTIRNCFSSGSVRGDQRVGGFCGGLIKNDTKIVNCYSTCEPSALRCAGGIVGFANLDKGSGNETNMPGNVIQGCIAWQPRIRTRTFDGDVSGNDYYSSAAIVGFTATHNYLTDCLRRSDLDFRDYSGNMTLYDQPNAGPDAALVVSNPNASVYKHYFPYHGKAFDGTLSQAARSLGWDETVWDLSGSVPVLTGAVEGEDPVDLPQSGAGDVPPGSDNLRGLGEVRPQPGDAGWTISNVADGITYYRYAANCPETENKYQDVYVIDLDLSNPKYEVKVVYASPSTVCSNVFAATSAYAAINGGYELGSIALKANGEWNGQTLRYYPLGKPVSYMPNNYITDNNGNQVPNWKSEGTFYCDGRRGLKIAFDGYDPNTSTKTKTVEEERLFYQLCTDEWPALISSAPVLIHDFNPVGKQFKNLHPKESSSPEDPNTHQRGQYPRTAVALTEGNHLLMVVCDGRYTAGYGGNGMSAYWLTAFLAKYFNPQYALNLDGGGSSTMCVKNSAFSADNYVVNYPCDNMDGGTTHDHAGQRKRDSFIFIVNAE